MASCKTEFISILMHCIYHCPVLSNRYGSLSTALRISQQNASYILIEINTNNPGISISQPQWSMLRGQCPYIHYLLDSQLIEGEWSINASINQAKIGSNDRMVEDRKQTVIRNYEVLFIMNASHWASKMNHCLLEYRIQISQIWIIIRQFRCH